MTKLSFISSEKVYTYFLCEWQSCLSFDQPDRPKKFQYFSRNCKEKYKIKERENITQSLIRYSSALSSLAYFSKCISMESSIQEIGSIHFTCKIFMGRKFFWLCPFINYLLCQFPFSIKIYANIYYPRKNINPLVSLHLNQHFLNIPVCHLP